MKIVGITGSTSERSTNRKLLQFMKKHFSKNIQMEIFDMCARHGIYLASESLVTGSYRQV